MNHDQLVRDLQSPSIKLLNSPNAPLILSFLYQEFKQNLRPAVVESELLEKLDLYLEHLREQEPQFYPGKPNDYLKQWCDEDHRWLRRYRGSGDVYVVELTPHSERALGWLQELQRRDIIGTESRFYQVISILNDLLNKSSEDVPTRLQLLEIEKERIEQEMERIRSTGEVESYNPTQIRERFQLALEGANQLIRDFSSVEESFREIARSVQEAQLQPDARKGMVVGSVLDAEEALRNSEVGRSFYTFWSYLQVPDKKDELNNLLDGVFDLPAIAALAGQTGFLRHITNHLITAGLKVDKSNHRLAEQLRRMLDEANLAESRRVRQLVSEIKHLYIQHLPNIEELFEVELERLPDAQLVMERELWQPPETTTFDGMLENNEPDIDEIDLSALLEQFHVDEDILIDRIELALEKQPTVTLNELVRHFPFEKGLSELVAYLAIASKHQRHRVDKTAAEMIAIVSNGDERLVQMPQIQFRRYAHES
jgi:hypothetical protein